mgnify:CR=1 FL=1|tara:strand:+ start:205 stop:423 length:219 start_codon:yes stop_codon:yes gene_type:complete
MNKKNKIKIKVNGKIVSIAKNCTLKNFITKYKIPLNKVAIELNNEIVDKKKTSNIILKSSDRIEIVQFIGGG